MAATACMQVKPLPMIRVAGSRGSDGSGERWMVEFREAFLAR